MKIAILGRQPEISIAELISLYGTAVKPLGTNAALVDTPKLDLSRLGGTIKVANLQAMLPVTDWDTISQQLLSVGWLENHLGRRDMGISIYGLRKNDNELFRLGLAMKKAWARQGYKLRVLKSTGGTLSAAQITHQKALDIVIVAGGGKTYLGTTSAVQDLEAYTERDHERPGRDARVGMLPPKLAQVMINLANPAPGSLVVDPFCGTGVVLQETLLMGYPAWGSDIEPRMVELTRTNMDWLAKNRSLPEYQLAATDATSLQLPANVGAIVSEGYLGPPMSSLARPAEIDHIKHDILDLYTRFLRNLASQLPTGTPLCLATPAWRFGQTFIRTGIVDQVNGLGYTIKVFKPTSPERLIYWRPGQIVGRDIIVLVRN